MTAPYKKRAKAGWNNDKEESNRSERIYEPTDIQDQLAETTPARKKQPKKSKDERKLQSLLRAVKSAKKLSRGDIESLNVHGEGWINEMKQSYYQAHKKAVVELGQMLLDEKLENKARRQIEEALT